MGSFLHLQLPRTIQLMPQPRIVGSRCKPLSIDPPCLPSWSSLSRGSHRPISMLVGAGGQDVGCMAEDHSHVDSKWRTRRCVEVPPPSVNGQSNGQKLIISSS